jgi:hypothetical protein
MITHCISSIVTRFQIFGIYNGAQIFQKYRINLKILVAMKVT